MKAQTFSPRLIERKLNSLKRGEVVQVVVCGVVLGGVDEEQAKLQQNKRDGLNFWKLLKVSWNQRFIGRKFNPLKRGEAVHVVVTEEVVGLVGVDDEQSRSPKKALFLECTTKRLLKARTFWSRFIGRKFNSLQRGEVGLEGWKSL